MASFHVGRFSFVRLSNVDIDRRNPEQRWDKKIAAVVAAGGTVEIEFSHKVALLQLLLAGDDDDEDNALVRAIFFTVVVVVRLLR